MFGTVYENELISDHQIMCPPNIYGNVVKVSPSPLTLYTRGRGLRALVLECGIDVPYARKNCTAGYGGLGSGV